MQSATHPVVGRDTSGCLFCNRHDLATAWRRLGGASEWEVIAAKRALLSDGAYQALLAAQPLFAGAAMVYGQSRHPLLNDGGLDKVRTWSRTKLLPAVCCGRLQACFCQPASSTYHAYKPACCCRHVVGLSCDA